MPKMRAKMKVVSVKNQGATYDELVLAAVCKNDGYPADGSDENNTFAKWTPSAEMKMSITNPALVGQIKEGQQFYVDFTLAE